MHQLRLFLIALQFFTRIPIPAWVGFDAAWLNQAARYFPAVGWVVAAASGVVFYCSALLWSQGIAVLLAMVASLLLTGAFHEDGFADMCDGFGGGYTAARILEIMQDSRIGAYGAIGIQLVLFCKWLTLTSMPTSFVIPALLLAHTFSRLASSSLIWLLNYVRSEGKAKPLAQAMSHGEMAIAIGTVVLPAIALIVWTHLPIMKILFGLGLLSLSTIWLAKFYVKRIGGYTGDCLGAVQQVTELCVYLGLCSSI